MDNYDLLSITIENEFLKNAIRWPSQGLFQAIRISVRRPLSGKHRSKFAAPSAVMVTVAR
jgi:hypothetical protein